jgi:hypothetical protein
MLKSKPTPFRAIRFRFLLAMALVLVVATSCGHSNDSSQSGAALLVTGGFAKGAALASAEVYVPSLKSFVATGSMNTARLMHTATLLLDGKVLVVGGATSLDFPAPVLSSAEIYDPVTRSFSVTGSLADARVNHTATALQDGTVLIAGGGDPNTNPLSSAELYDPMTGTFSAVGPMNIGREYQTATLLENGDVLIAGGFTMLPSGDTENAGTAELYNPLTGLFTFTGTMVTARDGHTATLLADGRVLIAGGGDNNGNVLATTEIYDPTTGQFTAAASMMTSRFGHFAASLRNGDVLIGGGIDDAGSSLASAERYVTKSDAFEEVYSMPRDRFDVNASELEFLHPPVPGVEFITEGPILIAGGFTQCPSSAVSFCLEPVRSVLTFDGTSNTFQGAPPMTTARGYYAAAALPITVNP